MVEVGKSPLHVHSPWHCLRRELGINLAAELSTTTHRSQVSCRRIQRCGAQAKTSMGTAEARLFPLPSIKVEARQADKASLDKPVELLKGLSLRMGWGAPHAVHKAAMACAGAKQPEPNLRVFKLPDCVEQSLRCCFRPLGGEGHQVSVPPSHQPQRPQLPPPRTFAGSNAGLAQPPGADWGSMRSSRQEASSLR